MLQVEKPGLKLKATSFICKGPGSTGCTVGPYGFCWHGSALPLECKCSCQNRYKNEHD
ncbi:hypothetical protein I79_006988 [Cricetulus griseus]|uniref:Uncharacterized protein n=1 Tax=Cricetulus griseus TaxID=10029 RepID=G3H9C1_CRIGR|nr:hypothetical protein I79_006988 [Cricetulus griseus]